jgi:hypothetical protein
LGPLVALSAAIGWKRRQLKQVPCPAGLIIAGCSTRVLNHKIEYSGWVMKESA